MRRHSWERISRIMKIPSRIPQISPWRKCSTSQRNWWANKKRLYNVDKIYWKNQSWKQLSLIGDETVLNLQRTKVYVFSDSVLCLGKIHSHPESNEAWEEKDWVDHHWKKLQRLWRNQMESRLHSSGTSSQDSLRCSSAVKSQIYWAD